MHNHHSMIIAAAIGALSSTTLTAGSPSAGTDTQPPPVIVTRPELVVVTDADVTWPLPRGTCPAFDLAPVAVVRPGPCGRLQPVVDRSASGGPTGSISISHTTPSPR